MKHTQYPNKPKTLVIDIVSNQVVDTLDIDITHTDARFGLAYWLEHYAQHREDPKKVALPDLFRDRLGFAAHWPNLTFAAEVQVRKEIPAWYSRTLPNLIKEEKRLIAEAFGKPA
jgi:hypothetical protein